MWGCKSMKLRWKKMADPVRKEAVRAAVNGGVSTNTGGTCASGVLKTISMYTCSALFARAVGKRAV